jgi:hypothetical protein
MPTTTRDVSDVFSDELHQVGAEVKDALRPAWRELADLARSWSSPLELATKLKALMAQRPMLALGAAVVIGAMLRGRVTRHRY